MKQADSRVLVEKNQKFDLLQGYLAEDYDGLGQFVAVALSRSSVDAVLHVRIPIGDSKQLRTFAAGTPVILFTKRGQLQVMSLGGGGGPELVYHRETNIAAFQPDAFEGDGFETGV